MKKCSDGKCGRDKVRGKRDALCKGADGKRAALRRKVRGAAAVAMLCVLASGCNTATPSSKSATSKACGNVTTVNNYIGLLPYPATNGVALQSGAVATGGGGLTISVSDLNGTIAQSADTGGGDRTDLSANPSLAAGLTGDAPMKAITDAVAAFAAPQVAADTVLDALTKRFGLDAATNAVAEAVGSACDDGSCGVKNTKGQ